MIIPLLDDIKNLTDEDLENRLPPAKKEPRSLHEAMRYSVFAGGKRFRPALVILACRACGGKNEDCLPAASAIEMVHTYSLIHDDLPAMDDDDMRRGKPSCHKKFGEAVAILAGDALLTLALETIAGLPAVAEELAKGAGCSGMIAGQVADIEAEGLVGRTAPEDLRDTVEYIHVHKTAALIRAACRMGAIAGGAGPSQMEALSIYGECLGTAFQISDDILDLTGDEKTLGKAARKDAGRGKLVHPAVFGLEGSRKKAEGLVQEAQNALRDLGNGAEPLKALAEFVVSRNN